MLADRIPQIAQKQFDNDTKYFARPSIAGPERCIRQMVYWGFGYPKKALSGRAILIFDDSSWHEELTADWIRKTEYKLKDEQKHTNILTPFKSLPERPCHNEKCKEIIPAGYIAGHIDGILITPEGEEILWEHKAINHFTFKMYEKGETLPLDNLAQVALYLRGLELDKALLLFKNKNTAQYLEFEISYTDDTLIVHTAKSSIRPDEKIEINKDFPNITAQAFEKFEQVQTCIDKNVLPERQYEHNNWHCSYCPYSEICWQDWETEIEQMSTDAELTEDIETMANYYLELSMHANEIEKEKKELKKQIKERMKDLNIRQGKAGKYILNLSVVEVKEQLRKGYKFEKLSIYKRKEG